MAVGKTWPQGISEKLEVALTPKNLTNEQEVSSYFSVGCRDALWTLKKHLGGRGSALWMEARHPKS